MASWNITRPNVYTSLTSSSILIPIIPLPRNLPSAIGSSHPDKTTNKRVMWQFSLMTSMILSPKTDRHMKFKDTFWLRVQEQTIFKLKDSLDALSYRINRGINIRQIRKVVWTERTSEVWALEIRSRNKRMDKYTRKLSTFWRKKITILRSITGSF